MIDRRYDWITGDFIVKLLKNICPNDKIIIDSVQIEDLFPDSEKTFCELKRITVQYNVGMGLSRKHSFVQKSMPNDTLEEYKTQENLDKLQEFRDFVFNKEISTYTKLASEIDHVLNVIDPKLSSIYPR